MSTKEKSYIRQLAEWSAVGLELGISVVAGLIVGDFIDRYFKTTPVFTLIFLALGFGGGVLNIFRLMKKLNQ
jgi:ATP synthase protein I